jgi:hypothetical protein
MKKILFITFLALSQFVVAQDKGTLKGLLTDKETNNEPLPFANVQIKGTSIGTTTDFDGNYILNVSAGNHIVVFSFLGYKTIEKPVTIKENETITINSVLSAEEGVSLDEIVVRSSSNKEKVGALLLEQKKAISIQTKIGAQELSAKGVGDVATALTKTTGISKEEGTGGVFVRGLGDRYNVTTLNGLPLPSNNPSRKNIDLDIFSTDIVGYIGINKTYNVNNYGDFAGANVDISSKNYTGKGFIEIGMGSGVNTEAISQSDFYLSDGPNSSGFYNKNYPAFPLNNYNFTTSWDRVKSGVPVNSSISLKGGDSYELGEDTKLNIFAVASFDNGFKFKEGVSRGSVNVSGVARRDYTFKSYAYETNATFMGNMVLKHKKNTFKYNGLGVNTSSQKQDEYTGTVDIFDYAPEGGAFVQRQTYERTQLIVHQLLGEHKLNDQFEVNWGGSYNFVDNKVPNRRQVILTPDNWDIPDGPKSFKQTNNESDNHRFYQNLEEEEIAARFSTSYKFSKNEDEEYKGKIILGYNGRFKNVKFRATQFNFRILDKSNQPIVSNIYDLDSYFNQENFNKGLFEIKTFRGGLGVTSTNVLLPQTYDGDQTIHAGYISLEYAFSDKFTGVFGVRGEDINQTISWTTSLDASGDSSELSALEILPSVSLKYVLNDEQNLKFAASKTYTLPQYKERALFQYEEVTQAYIGNPALYASTDYNVDLKWDYFPKSSEIISLGLFGKYIQNPINEATINSASNDISWVNSGDKATAIGAEFEIRKTLFEKEIEVDDSATLKNNLTFGFNASYMKSNQDLDGDKVVKETNERGFGISVDFTDTESRISGASDLLLNTDVSYFKDFKNDKSLQTTLAFNYFSDRIFALGTEGKGNLIDSSVGTLDLILKGKLSKNLGVSLTAKNILNPTIERKQETQDVIVSSYKAGANVKLSFSYNF